MTGIEYPGPVRTSAAELESIDMAAKKTILAKPRFKAGKVFTIVVRKRGGEFYLSLKPDQRIKGRELMGALKVAIHGMIETAGHIGKSAGMTKKQIADWLF